MEADLHFNWPLLVTEAVRRRRALKLTRSRLAKRAKLSLGTVERFEQRAKSVTMSAVLAILGALGMTDPRDLTFDGSFYIDIDDSVVFWSYDRGVQVPCRISYEALTKQRPNPKRERTEWVFMACQRGIEAIARRKYMLRRCEADGSVLVTKEDVARSASPTRSFPRKRESSS
jgi:transcriptional regulator with XRE-family HTH domain